MRNDPLSPDPAPAPTAGRGTRFELALVAAFKGGAAPPGTAFQRPPLDRR
ncbi:MAG: hypothetical protein PGN21_14395 [Sphingomonas paucimobilis]